MSFAYVPIGRACSIDRAAFAPGGQYVAVVGAPESRLTVLRTRDGKQVVKMREKNVEAVGFRVERGGEFDTELLYTVNKSNKLYRYSLKRNRALPPLELPTDDQVYSIATSWNGWFAATVSAAGDLAVFDLERAEPKRTLALGLSNSAAYAVAFESRSHNIVYAVSGGHIAKISIDGKPLDLISARTPWTCYGISGAGKEPGVALAGDGGRVWLLDLPYELPESDEYDLPWGNGKPMQDWERDQQPGVGDTWSLRNRVWCPELEANRCAFVDTDVGTVVLNVCLTEDRRLIVAGEDGVQVFYFGENGENTLCPINQTQGRRVWAVSGDGADVAIALT